MSKRVLELFNLGKKLWDATSPIRDVSSTFEAVTRNLEVNPPVPVDDENIVKVWAVLANLDRNVLSTIERSKSEEFNVFSKKEVAAANKRLQSEIDTLIKIKNVAALAKIISADLLSARTTTGLFIRIITLDFPATSLYAGREPMVDEIQQLADAMIARCERLGKTKKNMVHDARWILDLHNMN